MLLMGESNVNASLMNHSHQWSWPRITLTIGLRILLVTVLFTLMAFALGLFLGIIILAVVTAVRGQTDMSAAYRSFAIPAAFIGMFAGFVSMLTVEIRQLRRPRTRAALR